MTDTVRILGALVTAALLSCGPKGGTDVGNGATVSFNVRGFQAPPAGGAQSVVLASGVEVDALWIAVERFRIRPGEECNASADGEREVLGPLVVDLLSTVRAEALPELAVPSGPYCRVRLDLHEVALEELPPGAPAELAEHAVMVTGRRSDGVPFTARTNLSTEFRLDAKDEPVLIAAGENALIIGYELDGLVASLDLDSHAGPTIMIDDASAPQTVAAFDKALRAAARLFRDEDEDGALSPSESAPGKELAEDAAN